MNGKAFATVTQARKQTRNRMRKRCQKPDEQCRGQTEQCRSVYTVICEGKADCEAATFACCEHLARCDVTEALACLYALG
jgi:hypothetical protein